LKEAFILFPRRTKLQKLRKMVTAAKTN